MRLKKRFMVLALTSITLVSCSHIEANRKISSYDNEVINNVDSNLKHPCGLSGSIEKRIKDCSEQESSKNGSFVLVTRTKKLKEIHKDTKSGLLWGDFLSGRYHLPSGRYKLPREIYYDNAIDACKADHTEVGGVSMKWRLPTIEEYKAADINGIRTALSEIDDLWWSSSSATDQSEVSEATAWVYNGRDGSVEDMPIYQHQSARCVARAE